MHIEAPRRRDSLSRNQKINLNGAAPLKSRPTSLRRNAAGSSQKYVAAGIVVTGTTAMVVAPFLIAIINARPASRVSAVTEPAANRY
jgi:hypothetical protein